DVIEKRQDGYHNIDGIMQMIDLYDEVEVKISDKFEITSNSKDIPLDEKNLVYKVYKALKEKYKFNERFSILIEKNIPVSAGIAGGSTNSAVVIEMIDEILGLNMSLDDKKQIGKSVGADIPYLLVGKTARTRGIGDELEILDSLPTTDILIVNNGVEIATPYVYSNIVPSGNSDRIDKLINVYKNKNYDEFFKGLYNVMEKVSISYCPEIQNIKDKMYEFNCIKSLMSGSGPTVFGIFNDDKDIKKAYDYFKKIYKNTFIVKTMER
ncbi:MAG: 4-(cytidine 5'-diphospho)-2-C-methyl-D-erythritol kinase, partial [Parvimonas micra]|nr:4-(cytidine 5'-diphospho)-2-C-methyl-D-erythritol kinase [Parvimonas micra]